MITNDSPLFLHLPMVDSHFGYKQKFPKRNTCCCLLRFVRTFCLLSNLSLYLLTRTKVFFSSSEIHSNPCTSDFNASFTSGSNYYLTLCYLSHVFVRIVADLWSSRRMRSSWSWCWKQLQHSCCIVPRKEGRKEGTERSIFLWLWRGVVVDGDG